MNENQTGLVDLGAYYCGKKHWLAARAFKMAGICLLVLSMCIVSGCSKKSGQDIIVAGSTSVQPFAEALSEEFMRLNSGVKVDVQGGGSSSGIKAAQTDTAQIGMSSRDLAGDETSLWNVKIATDGLVIIVSKENPVAALTTDQVRDIYTGKVTNWSQFGGEDAKIHIITREEGSGTRSAFESLVMQKSEITPTAMVQDSNGAVRKLVGDDKAAIGFISLGLVDETIKALVLNGVAASKETIADGSYQLWRPFMFVTHFEPTGMTKEFIDFVLSPDGQKILSAEGLVTNE